MASQKAASRPTHPTPKCWLAPTEAGTYIENTRGRETKYEPWELCHAQKPPHHEHPVDGRRNDDDDQNGSDEKTGEGTTEEFHASKNRISKQINTYTELVGILTCSRTAVTYKIVRVQWLKTAVFIWTCKHEFHVFPGAFNGALNSPTSMEILKRRRWNRIFRSFRWKRVKRNTSEGIPFFSKNFRWKSMFHLIYHRNNRFFYTKGKRPKLKVPMNQKSSNLHKSKSWMTRQLRLL